jgi:protein-disulfide isomerase
MTNARTARTAREKAAELRAEAARAEARRRTLIITISVAAVIAVVVGVGIFVQQARKQNQAAVAASTPANLGGKNSILVGQPTAKNTLVLYEDFQCPICKEFETADAGQISQWVSAGTVKVEYRPIAFLDRMSDSQYSTRSLNAAAAVVTTKLSAFEKFHALLFQNQPPEQGHGLPDATLIDLAVQAGADKSAITPLITGQKYASWVAKATDQASKDGVNGTPTIIINGKTVDTTKISGKTGFDPAAFKSTVEAQFVK